MIVLTGSGGVIGRAVATSLASLSLPVLTLQSGTLHPSRWPNHLAESEIKPSFIVHLASAVPRPPSSPDSHEMAAKTEELDRTVLQIAEQFHCRIIYASGCFIYADTALATGASEDSDTKKVSDIPSAYQVAKLLGEQRFLSYPLATVLRITTPIGPGVSQASALGSLLHSAATNGYVRYAGSGNREQDYVDVVDIARAIEAVMSAGVSGIFNIGSSRPVTMRELAELIVSLSPGVELAPPYERDLKEGERMRILTGKAVDQLSWSPSVSLKDSVGRLLSLRL